MSSVDTLSEQLIVRLRGDLIEGRLPPNQRLRMGGLEQRYGMSSSPLREALNRLVEEGLVVADQRRGFSVASMSLEDLDEITRMRVLLDPAALADSIAQGDRNWECEVVARFHRLEAIERDLGDQAVRLTDDWTDAHRQFHLSLLGACRSSRHRRWCASLFDQAERYRRLAARHRSTPRSKAAEHRELMDYVLARRVAAATEFLSAHIQATAAQLHVAVAEGRIRFSQEGSFQ
jgi:DNA-binding GntR family transcriptional regulator